MDVMIGTFTTVIGAVITGLAKIKQDREIDLAHARISVDRACAVLRDFLLYYDLARQGHELESLPYRSCSGWKEALEHIKRLYSEVVAIRARSEQLKEDPYYDVEKQWKPVINRWIL